MRSKTVASSLNCHAHAACTHTCMRKCTQSTRTCTRTWKGTHPHPRPWVRLNDDRKIGSNLDRGMAMRKVYGYVYRHVCRNMHTLVHRHVYGHAAKGIL